MEEVVDTFDNILLYEKDTSCLRHAAGGDQDGSFGKGVPKEQ